MIPNSSLNLVEKSTTLASISKEVFGIGNIINTEHFSDLIKCSVYQRGYYILLLI